jgi:predicted metal-binding membrane protein
MKKITETTTNDIGAYRVSNDTPTTIVQSQVGLSYIMRGRSMKLIGLTIISGLQLLGCPWFLIILIVASKLHKILIDCPMMHSLDKSFSAD